MRDTKSSLLLILSLTLFVLSFALLCTWGYNTYSKKQDNRPHTEIIIKGNPDDAKATRDSLQKLYQATLSNMYTRFDSTANNADSLTNNLDLKLAEFYKLRNEIALILKNPTNAGDLETARLKITELQRKVRELSERSMDVEQENRRLFAILQKLNSDNKTVDQGARHAVFETKPQTEATNATTVFNASDLRLSAIMGSNDGEQETFDAEHADKLLGSFVIKSSQAPFNNAEIFIVVLRPDGRVLQNSAWETGTFETREGRKIYSARFRFDYPKPENKRLLFSVTSDSFQKGDYCMQLYCNGVLIGKLYKTLS